MFPWSQRWKWGGWVLVPIAIGAVGLLVLVARLSIEWQWFGEFGAQGMVLRRWLLQLVAFLLAMGLGEAPLIRQCTFSVWRDTSSMLHFAQQGAHHQAIQAAYKQDFFSESMFVRMRILSMRGDWQGQHYDRPQELAHA